MEWIYLVLTVGTMFAVVGAVTLVTGSLATQVFGDALSPFGYSAVLLLISAVVLFIGRYPLLDGIPQDGLALLRHEMMKPFKEGTHPPRVGGDIHGIDWLSHVINWTVGGTCPPLDSLGMRILVGINNS